MEYEWDHPLGEIVTALIEAGLTIEYLHEFRRLGSHQSLDWPCLGKRPDGSFALRRLRDEYPLSFSLRAALRRRSFDVPRRSRWGRYPALTARGQPPRRTEASRL